MDTRHDKHWAFHPWVKTGKELSFGDRAADWLRAGMGSWIFIFGFLGIMTVWMLGNGDHGFDPFPYILLNLGLSTLAGLQGGILLISAKRQDAINAQLAKSDRELSSNDRKILKAIQEHLGIPDPKE